MKKEKKRKKKMKQSHVKACWKKKRKKVQRHVNRKRSTFQKKKKDPIKKIIIKKREKKGEIHAWFAKVRRWHVLIGGNLVTPIASNFHTHFFFKIKIKRLTFWWVREVNDWAL